MIDVLLATHNSERYLRPLLDSLLAQDTQEYHLIVGDDDSSDETLAILREYAPRFACGMEIHEFHYKKSSAKENFFRLLDFSCGEYIMFADHDDVWLSQKILDTLSVMQAAERQYGDIPLLIHGDLKVVDEQLRTLSDSLFSMQRLDAARSRLNYLLCQNIVTGCTVMINGKLRAQLCSCDVSRIIMHDWWLALIASAFGKIIFMPQPLILYRQHRENEVGAKNVASGSYVAGRLQNSQGICDVLHATYVQADEFKKVYGEKLSQRNYKVVAAFAGFLNCSKAGRIFRMFRYRLFKNTLTRKIGQIIWG